MRRDEGAVFELKKVASFGKASMPDLPVSRPDRPLRHASLSLASASSPPGRSLSHACAAEDRTAPAPPDEGGAPTEFLFVEKGDVDVGEFPPFEFEAGEEGDADARRHEGHDEIKLAAAQALIELQPTLAADGLDAVVEQEAHCSKPMKALSASSSILRRLRSARG